MSTLTHTEEYDGLAKGDLVRVFGLQGMWRFQCYTRNEDTGSAWITVYGPVRADGKPHDGHQSLRSFEPTRIRKPKGART